MSRRRERRSRSNGSTARSRTRTLTRTVVVLLTLVVVLLLVDRTAALVTEHRLGSRIQQAQGLAGRPMVRIRGFPFLAQVIRGRYDRVDLASAGPIVAQGVEIDHAEARLESVRVRTADALRGTVPNLPVDAGHGSAVVPYPSINVAVKRYGGTAGSVVTVAAAGAGRARLVGPLGVSVGITAKVEGGRLLITPSAADLDRLPGTVSSLVSDALAAPIPLPPFPFNVRLASGSFEPDGLHLAARSRDSVFPVR